MVQYQDPQQADSILKIQRELDETKVVLQKTIDSVLQRGEKIDTLVQKSDGLSAQSKMFYTQVGWAPNRGTICRLLTKRTGQEAELVLHRYVKPYPLWRLLHTVRRLYLDSIAATRTMTYPITL
jgi:hypothetical protein